VTVLLRAASANADGVAALNDVAAAAEVPYPRGEALPLRRREVLRHGQSGSRDA